MIEVAAIGFGDEVVTWLWMCLGVVISILLPVLAAAVRSQFGSSTAGIVDLKKYLLLGAFSGLTAILLLAVYRQAKPDESITVYAALLAGYGWQATLEKIGFGPKI